VLGLHDLLCFLRAFPDDADVLARATRMLAAFERRRDLRRHRDALADSGIAGTMTTFPFFAPTARWLARRWGEHLTVDWSDVAKPERLEPYLPVLATWTETPVLDDEAEDVPTWLDRLKGPGETDASFLFRRLDQVRIDPVLLDELIDALDLPLTLAPGTDTPCRTREHLAGARVHYQTTPLERGRPDVDGMLARGPRSVRAVGPAAGRRLVTLARSAMVVRQRDLDAFMYGDARDVRLADFGDGYRIACIGMVPERRLLLESQYAYLVLRNGVPVGYGTLTSLFGSTEAAYTIFDTYRGAEAAAIFTRVLAFARHEFGVDAFMVDPYQLGQDNEDAVASGAWWFYRKLGFEPRDETARRSMRREEGRMRRDAAHRSTPATLRRLADVPVFRFEGRPREDVLGRLPLAEVGRRAMAFLSERFGHDRRRAGRACAEEAARRLGAGRLAGVKRGERLAWERWGPLVLLLPGLERWSRAERRALAGVVRAKGGRRESDYQRRFDAHAPLRRALRRLMGAAGPGPS